MGHGDPCAPNKKCISLKVEGFDRSVVPIQHLSLSKMSPLGRRDLGVRLKRELEKVMKLQEKISSFSFDATLRPNTAPDVHADQCGPKGHAVVESLPISGKDERVALGKKKFPSGRNGPRTKGGAVTAKRNESVKQGPAQTTSFFMLLKQCDTLLTRLMAHHQCWIFNEPVDIVKHNIPDYFRIIKHPMDLGTVKKKLLSNQYRNLMDFAADVRLTFSNAMTYNPIGHTVHDMADEMNKYFEVRWKAIEKKISPTADEPTASKSSVIIETEKAYVSSAKKQKTTSMENSVKRENDKRAMSDVEKHKLGVDLEELLAELPDNIITFLKESTSNVSQVSEDEIEIEIDALSYETLFTLRTLLDDYLLEKQKKQTTLEPCKNEMQNESGFNSSSIQPCKDNEPADENVDIGVNDVPPAFSSLPFKTDEYAAPRNNKCSSSRSSSNSDSGSSSDSELDGDKNSVFANTVNVIADAKVKQEERDLADPNNEDFLNGSAEQNNASHTSSVEPRCHQKGESAPQESQVSPDKLYRAALLRSRFADIIIKAQENSLDKGERSDPERLKREKDDLEKRRREEKARLQAEAKAAEVARKKAEAEALEEAKRKRELEREAARQALLKMEKTVDINENSQFMEDLEMFRSGQDEPLQCFIEAAASPDNSQNGLGSFKFQASSNPLEQLGLYMKNDDDEEEEIEPQSNLDASNDPEEGEID